MQEGHKDLHHLSILVRLQQGRVVRRQVVQSGCRRVLTVRLGLVQELCECWNGACCYNARLQDRIHSILACLGCLRFCSSRLRGRIGIRPKMWCLQVTGLSQCILSILLASSMGDAGQFYCQIDGTTPMTGERSMVSCTHTIED